MGKVDPEDPRPPYQQVADDLRAAIRAGKLALGSRLPKQPELADAYGVSIGTVKSALAVLREESLIVSRQGEGSWVRRTLPDPASDPEQTAETDVPALLTQMLSRLDELSARLASIEDRLPRRGS